MLYVYHNTSKDNAENIRKTGVMSAKEDGIFVSTKPDGQSEFDISSDIRYNEIKGKSFLLIDDNSTTGRTFKGLEGFIEDNGGKVVGYYAMTTGQDMSEKMITTDETQKKVERIGIGKIRGFAESEGIRREISRNGLTERETRELIRQYRKKVDKRRTNSFLSKKGGTKAEIQRVYENGRRDSEKDRTRGKFSLKSSNSSNLDTGENNTDNVQIEIDGNEDFIDNLREKLYNEETKKLTQAQKDLLRGLKIFRVDEECIIVIMLMTQKAFQTEMMIDYMISHEKATQEELLSKAMEISKLKGKSY